MAVAGVLFVGRRMPPAADRSAGSKVVHATIELPPEAPMAPAWNTPLSVPSSPLAISRDGTMIAYVAQIGSTRQLYVRPLHEAAARPLPGTEEAYRPAFSPDGLWVAFLTPSRIKKSMVAGGGTITLCTVCDDTYGLVWGADGWVYFSDAGTLKRVPAGGGSPTTMQDSLVGGFTSAEGGIALLGSFAYGAGGNGDFRPLQRLDLASGRSSELGVLGHSASVLPGRLLVVARNNGLSAVALNRHTGPTMGETLPVLARVETDALHWVANYAVSDFGTLVYVEGGDLGMTVPVWVDRAGQVRPVPAPARPNAMFELSPDGRTIATVVQEAGASIVLVDLETGNTSAAALRGAVTNPFWAPDGQRLLHVAWLGGRVGIHAVQPSAMDRPSTLVYQAPPDAVRLRIHSGFRPPDGRVLFSVSRSAGRVDYLLLAPDGSVAPAPPAANGGFLQLSPDGQWIASTRNHSGRSEIFVQRYPDGPTTQVTFHGGEEARWSPQGDELIYRYGPAWIAVPVTFATECRPGPARELFRGPFANINGYSFAVAPEGERFLLLLPQPVGQPQSRLRVVVNWAEEVRRRLADAAKTP